jgi:bifunctional DNA-binding transcriptional regulator/antitoxin component of YhaV-PrlF toxin-antitoxin module
MKLKLYKGGVLKLPVAIRRELGLREGDEFLVTIEGGY